MTSTGSAFSTWTTRFGTHVQVRHTLYRVAGYRYTRVNGINALIGTVSTSVTVRRSVRGQVARADQRPQRLPGLETGIPWPGRIEVSIPKLRARTAYGRLASVRPSWSCAWAGLF
jgi:hypothetical protein